MPQISCPNCGASVESTDRACSYCGAALPSSVSSSAPTVRASREELDALLKDSPASADATFVSTEPLKKFRSSAEAMDAVKVELRAGRKINAVKIYREYFDSSLADAKNAVDQIEYDLKFETVIGRADADVPDFARPDAPTTFAQAVSSPVIETPKKSGIPAWVWGCAAAFLLFCCLCVVLPAVLYLLTQNM